MSTELPNEIIAIGWLSGLRCYLNVPLIEAKRRYLRAQDIPNVDGMSDEAVEAAIAEEDVSVRAFRCGDEFGAYDVWSES